MPTVLRIGSYRFFFFAGDKNEKAHVHIEKDNKIAKFWLNPVRLENSGRFNRYEINYLFKVVVEYNEHLIRSWNEYFND